MPIRPIDIQNMIARLDNFSKSISLSQNSEAIIKQIQEKKSSEISIQKKDGIASIEKIKDDENKLSKIEKFKKYDENKGRKRKNQYYNNENEDEHTFEKKNIIQSKVKSLKFGESIFCNTIESGIFFFNTKIISNF